TKLTTGTAIAFMLTSLILTWGASRSPSSGLLERLPAPAAETQPAPPPSAPEGAPATPPANPPPEGAPGGEQPAEQSHTRQPSAAMLDRPPPPEAFPLCEDGGIGRRASLRG